MTAADVIDVIGDNPMLWIVNTDNTATWSSSLRETFGQELCEWAKRTNGYIVTDGTNSLYNKKIINIVSEYNKMFKNKVELIAVVERQTIARQLNARLVKNYSYWIENLF